MRGRHKERDLRTGERGAGSGERRERGREDGRRRRGGWRMEDRLMVDGWMNGWIDGWIDGWVDGWMDGWMWEERKGETGPEGRHGIGSEE
jgi:hypothetical protein